jgi:hypothetical protein
MLLIQHKSTKRFFTTQRHGLLGEESTGEELSQAKKHRAMNSPRRRIFWQRIVPGEEFSGEEFSHAKNLSAKNSPRRRIIWQRIIRAKNFPANNYPSGYPGKNIPDEE